LKDGWRDTVDVEKLGNRLVVKGFSFEVPLDDNEKFYKDEDDHKKTGAEDNFLYIYAGLEGCSFIFCCSTLRNPLEKAW